MEVGVTYQCQPQRFLSRRNLQELKQRTRGRWALEQGSCWLTTALICQLRSFWTLSANPHILGLGPNGAFACPVSCSAFRWLDSKPATAIPRSAKGPADMFSEAPNPWKLRPSGLAPRQLRRSPAQASAGTCNLSDGRVLHHAQVLFRWLIQAGHQPLTGTKSRQHMQQATQLLWTLFFLRAISIVLPSVWLQLGRHILSVDCTGQGSRSCPLGAGAE